MYEGKWWRGLETRVEREDEFGRQSKDSDREGEGERERLRRELGHRNRCASLSHSQSVSQTVSHCASE